jgi:alpha-N-arabinofuranosidase
MSEILALQSSTLQGMVNALIERAALLRCRFESLQKQSFYVAIKLIVVLAVGRMTNVGLARQPDQVKPVAANERATTTTGDRNLENSGFESGTDGWSTHVYGARSTIESDSTITHGGKKSLRISAAEPSDTALGQELMLHPGHWYRLHGWVRTRSLDPRGAPVFGTFQIQMPGGAGIIASGRNHQGHSDWSEVTIDFAAPSGGRTRIAVFFVGFGKGTGTAWFDDLKIEEVDLAAEPIRVTRERLPGTISPLQYGQFIEYLCDLVPGMWAEKLYDGAFEGLTPYKFAFIRETDFKERPWLTVDPDKRGDVVRDRQYVVSGDFSQRIRVPEGKLGGAVGIFQEGLAVDDRVACRFSVSLRQEGLRGSVKVRLLRTNGQELASTSFEPRGEWQKFQRRLVPAASDTNARLEITLDQPGTLWIDNASLMPEDSVGGWRRDVVAAVKALKPGVIRFGGSALDEASLGEFEWKDTIGDPDRRKPFRAWGGLQPTGPGLEEIVQFCRLVDAEPLICVRFSKRTPQDAAEQVQYFNGAPDTPLGALRARNGHAEPYRIKYWQVGNERAGADYEASLAAICRAMQETDPSITVLSSYPTAGVLQQAADRIRYVCPHQYNCADLDACQRELDATRSLIQRFAPGKSIKVAVTEWNTTAGDWGPRRAMLWTLENALACSRYHNFLHRQADLVDIANRSNLTNSFCSGIIQTDNHRLYKTPTWYAQQLYATHAGSQPLKIDTAAPHQSVPDVSATLSQDGSTATLFAVNFTVADVVRPMDFSAFDVRPKEISIWTLADCLHTGEPNATNSFDEPERISASATTFSVDGPKFNYKFPALSLTVLEWPGKNGIPTKTK